MYACFHCFDDLPNLHNLAEYKKWNTLVKYKMWIQKLLIKFLY